MPTATMANVASAEVAMASRGRGSSHSIQPLNPAERVAGVDGVPGSRAIASAVASAGGIACCTDICSIQSTAAIRSSRRVGDRTSSASKASRSAALMPPSR